MPEEIPEEKNNRLKPLEIKTLAEKLFLVNFKPAEKTHLIVDQEVCKDCSKRVCLKVCPANVYTWEDEGDEICVSFEGCLECGTCRISCSEEALTWLNPDGGFGVSYQYG